MLPGRICIVGCGLIGGSLLRALHARGQSGLVAIDHDQATGQAIQAGLGLTALSEISGIEHGDLIVLAMPVPATLGAFAKLAPAFVGKRVIVTDVAGIKQPVLEEARRALPDSIPFVGGHPMAGRELGGFSASDARLFDGRTVAICAAADADRGAVARVEAMWREVGAHVMRCDAEAHDRAVARISHLPHLVAASLALVAGRGDALSDSLASSGLRDTTRVAVDPTIRFALAMNSNVPALAREVARELNLMADALDSQAGISSALDEAASTRRRIFPA